MFVDSNKNGKASELIEWGWMLFHGNNHKSSKTKETQEMAQTINTR